MESIALLEARRTALTTKAGAMTEANSYEMNDGQIKVKADHGRNAADVYDQLRKIDGELDTLYALVGGCAVTRMRTF